VARFQAVVTRDHHQDHLAYDVELAAGAAADPQLTGRIADALREAVKVRGEVRVVAPGSIPEGAKRLDDRRVWK
jgi:phenylacetate-CoA ligase